MQAAGSWSFETCCRVFGSDCHLNREDSTDHASSSNWLFGLWPGPPKRFGPTGTDADYQEANADYWPIWGQSGGLSIGGTAAPGGSYGACNQGSTYRGASHEICGGNLNWGATDVEVWYQR